MRTAVNNRLFEKVASQMSPVEIAYLDRLYYVWLNNHNIKRAQGLRPYIFIMGIHPDMILLGDEPPHQSSEQYAATLSDLKAIPKNATISHIRELQTKFDRLMSFGDAQSLVKLFSSPVAVLPLPSLNPVSLG